jgi:uncharacterized SAM-binding protein YcdF (DUF218 family)
MLFYFKKFISTFFFPLSLCLELFLFGLFFLWLTKKQKAGKILFTCGVILFIFVSYGFFSDTLLRSLENTYPPLLTQDEDNVHNLNSVKWIVVLSGGSTYNSELSPVNQVTKDTLIRLVEGIRLHRRLPGSKLVFTGKGNFTETTSAEIMAQAAYCLGVKSEEIILEKKSKDTKDHAVYLKSIVNDDPFIVVTAASHMLRSMALFKKQGMNPIAAPTGHLIKGEPKMHARIFFPQANRVRRAERLVYEYLGILWAKIRGQI